jgi:hypothetical protein
MQDKALGRSISFRPAKLHAAGIAFGDQQTPKLNVSEVVCDALREYFAARGYKWEEEGAQSMQAQQRAAYLIRMETLGIDIDKALAGILAEHEAAQPAEAVAS